MGVQFGKYILGKYTLENSLSKNALSENTFSEIIHSENTLSENTLSENILSKNTPFENTLTSMTDQQDYNRTIKDIFGSAMLYSDQQVYIRISKVISDLHV